PILKREHAPEQREGRNAQKGCIPVRGGSLLFSGLGVHELVPAPRPRLAMGGRAGGFRTPNLRFWRPPLYQLSYRPSVNGPRKAKRGADFRESAPASQKAWKIRRESW